MSHFDQLWEWLKHLDRGKELRLWFERQPLPSILFSNIRTVDNPPCNEEIEVGDFYLISPMNHPKWVLFRCPCGCNSVITLSLQKAHQPHWSAQKSVDNRPILFPSIWRDAGCMSHFWIHDGRVYWCHDTGTSPFARYTSNWP